MTQLDVRPSAGSAPAETNASEIAAHDASRADRLRALVVEDGTPGGISRAVEYLIGEWASEAGVAAEGAPEVQRLELRGEGSLKRSAPRYALALASVAQRLLRGRPDLIHLNITQRGSTYRALPVVVLARLAGVPVLLHLHSSEYRDFVASLRPPLLAVVRWMFGASERVAVLGESWAEFARDELRVAPARLDVVPNAVPGPRALPQQREPGPPRILFLGQVGRRKGAGDLLQALAQPSMQALEWVATLAGNGDVEAHRQQAADLGLGERVHFTGWVDREGVQRELARADIMVLPSHAEGLPLSILEGIAHGLAVVSTPVGAIGEVIEDGETGLLVPPGQPTALAAALARVVSDEGLRSGLASAGRARWEERHDVRAYGRRMARLYALTASRGR